jgi:PAS domain S-box-containing protein
VNSLIRVLLLEGNEADKELIENEFRSSGLSVDLKHVSNKTDFFRTFDSFQPDLVLSDYVIGTLKGSDVMAELRKKHPKQPFIFVSWQIHEASVIEALRNGATDYIFKEQLSRLLLSVHRALRELEEGRLLDRALKELQESEEYFRSLIENAADIILVLDDAGIICYASPSVTKLLGYETDGFVGQNLLNFIHAEDVENAHYALTQDLEKKDLSLEFRFRRKDGLWRGLEAAGKRVDEPNGRFKTIINARDITDRILEQEALRESIIRHLKTQTELQKTQQKIIQQERMAAIGQMASGIAHDFSNALMPVLGFSEILMNRPEAMRDLEKVRKYIEMINTSARDAMHIVSGLREFYRQKEKIENLLPMNVNKAIEQAVLLTQPKWREEWRAKSIDIQISMKLGSVPEIVGNEASLREALINLIFNAIDAMPKGGLIQFKTCVDEEQVLIEVSDNGIGMDEETRLHCFEPFFSTKGKGGTGLGLSMVYGVIRRHEGMIEIKSKPGKGSRFIISLPVRVALSVENGSSQSVLQKAAKPMSVLVVDDEAMVRDVLREYLSGDGHSVETAGDGYEALKLFGKKKFDLVITDRAMPEMSGDQLITEIKRMEPKIPLIMLTGFGELMKAKGEHPAGADHLLSKPLTFEAYREVIAKVASS